MSRFYKECLYRGAFLRPLSGGRMHGPAFRPAGRPPNWAFGPLAKLLSAETELFLHGEVNAI